MVGTDYDELRRLVIEVADCGWNVATEITDGILARPEIVARALITKGHASLTLMDGTPVYLIGGD